MFIPQREDGQGLVEYALILVLIAVVIILILSVLGSSVFVVYARVTGALSGQSISNTGREYVVVNVDATVTSGGGCNLTINNVQFVALQDGELVDEGTGTFQYSLNGSSSSRSVTLDGNLNETGQIVSGYTAPCPIRMTTPSGYSNSFGP